MADTGYKTSNGLSHAYLAAHHAMTKTLLPRDVTNRIHKMALPLAGGKTPTKKEIADAKSGLNGAIPGGGFPIVEPDLELGPLVSSTPILMAEDGGDLQNTMVAHFPPPDVAMKLHAGDDLPKGGTAQDPDDMHCTIVFCGKLGSDDFDKLRDALADFTSKEASIPAAVAGSGAFVNTDPRAAIAKAAVHTATPGSTKVVHGLVDAPGISGLRERLAAHLKKAGVAVSEDHGFTPHISLANVPSDSTYAPAIDATDPPAFQIDSLTAARGDERHTYPLQGDTTVAKTETGGGGDGSAAHDPSAVTPSSELVKWDVPIIKTETAKQIVTGLVLVPGQKDSQGDRMTAEEIERTAYDFLAHYNAQGVGHTGDARDDIKVVESYIAPQTFLMKGDDGKDHTVPKGTWLLSSRLPDDLWAQRHLYRSYSMQGHGTRTVAA